jgi:hypothetical protein
LEGVESLFSWCDSLIAILLVIISCSLFDNFNKRLKSMQYYLSMSFLIIWGLQLDVGKRIIIQLVIWTDATLAD